MGLRRTLAGIVTAAALSSPAYASSDLCGDPSEAGYAVQRLEQYHRKHYSADTLKFRTLPSDGISHSVQAIDTDKDQVPEALFVFRSEHVVRDGVEGVVVRTPPIMVWMDCNPDAGPDEEDKYFNWRQMSADYELLPSMQVMEKYFAVSMEKLKQRHSPEDEASFSH